MTDTARERTQFGKTRRSHVSRTAHAELKPKERNFDPIHILRSSTEGRVQQLLPLKYARMQASPFSFFRGSVAIMAADLGRLPNSGIHAQLCGDAHVQNLGSFAAPDGKLVFDINDFDETIRGPWEWDVKRMATSLILAGQESGHSRAGCRDAVETFAGSYCASVRQFAQQPVLAAARHQIHREQKIEPIHIALRQSQRASPLELLKRYTEKDSRGKRRFRNMRPTLWRLHSGAKDVLDSLETYRNNLTPEQRHIFNLFHSIDVGFKVVGTGSVGLRDYVVLFEGNGPRDPLFLQIKQEVRSVYANYLPHAADSQADIHQGQRVAQGQRSMQPLSDLLLGWTTIGHHQYLVRQLNDHKGSIDLENLSGVGLEKLAAVAGELLARGHTRSGDACQIHGYSGSGIKISKALRAFASDYADQTEADYHAFIAEIKGGRIKVAEQAN